MAIRQYRDDLSDVPFEIGDPVDNAVAGSDDDFSRGSGKSLKDLIDRESSEGDRVTVMRTPAQLIAGLGSSAFVAPTDTNVSDRAVDKNNTTIALVNDNSSETDDPYRVWVPLGVSINIDSTTNKGISILTGSTGDGAHFYGVNDRFFLNNPDDTTGADNNDYAFISEAVSSDGSLSSGFEYGTGGNAGNRPTSFLNTGSGDTLRALLEDSRSANFAGTEILGFLDGSTTKGIRAALGDLHYCNVVVYDTNTDDDSVFAIYPKPDAVHDFVDFIGQGYTVGTRLLYIITDPLLVTNSRLLYFTPEVSDNARSTFIGVDVVGDYVITFREGSQGGVALADKKNGGEPWHKNINPPASIIYDADDLDGNYRFANTGNSLSSSANRCLELQGIRYAPDGGPNGEGVQVRLTVGLVPGNDDPGIGGDWLAGSAPATQPTHRYSLDLLGQINETSAYIPDTGETDGVISHANAATRGIKPIIRSIGPEANVSNGNDNFTTTAEVKLSATSIVEERHIWSLAPDGSFGMIYTLSPAYLTGVYKDGDPDNNIAARAGQNVNIPHTYEPNPHVPDDYNDIDRTITALDTQINTDFVLANPVDGNVFLMGILSLYGNYDDDTKPAEDGGVITFDSDISLGVNLASSGVGLSSGVFQFRCAGLEAGATITGIQDGSASGNIEINLNGVAFWGFDATGVDSDNLLVFNNPITGTDSTTASAFRGGRTLEDVQINVNESADARIVMDNIAPGDTGFTINNESSNAVSVAFQGYSTAPDFSKITFAGTTLPTLLKTVIIDWGIDLENDGYVYLYDRDGGTLDSDYLQRFDSGTSGVVDSTALQAVNNTNDFRVVFIKRNYDPVVQDASDIDTRIGQTITVTGIEPNGGYNADADDVISGSGVTLEYNTTDNLIDIDILSGGADGVTKDIPSAQRFMAEQVIDDGTNADVYARSLAEHGEAASFVYNVQQRITWDDTYWQAQIDSTNTVGTIFLSLFPVAGKLESDLLNSGNNANGTLVSIQVTSDSTINYNTIQAGVIAQHEETRTLLEEVGEDASLLIPR